MAVPSATMAAVANPAVPQFSVKITDTSYDVPSSTTTTVDEFTGEKTATTNPEYRVGQLQTEISIKNQPFKPYTDADGKEYRLYYRIETKGHFGDQWYPYRADVFQTNSAYTTISQYSGMPESAGQMDFRVAAIVGYTGAGFTLFNLSFVYDVGGGSPYTCVANATSGWSDIVTVSVPGDVTSTPSPTQTATLPPSSSTADVNSQPSVPDQTSTQTQQPDDVFAKPLFLLSVGALIGGFVGGGVASVLFVVLFKRRQKALACDSKLSQNSCDFVAFMDRWFN